MSFININWYIALAFCLFFFIGGRQLAEIPGGTPRARRAVGLILLLFAAPAALFPFAYIPAGISGAPWYNTFRSINRIELFSALIAPAAGYVTYLRPDSPYKGYNVSAREPIIRVIKPLAFPLCVLLISINFIGPLIKPLDKEAVYKDMWADNEVLMQSTAQSSGPAALVSAMHSLNNYTDSEMDVVKGTYTDREGAEFWYLARYAVNRGYRARFIKPADISDVPAPSIITVTKIAQGSKNETGPRSYIALLKRSKNGILTIGDPKAGLIELTAEDYPARYGDPDLALALSVPKGR